MSPSRLHTPLSMFRRVKTLIKVSITKMPKEREPVVSFVPVATKKQFLKQS